MEAQGEHKLELNFTGTSKYLNYWDWAHGRDVVCEIKDGKLYENGKEISFKEFLEKVEESILKMDI